MLGIFGNLFSSQNEMDKRPYPNGCSSVVSYQIPEGTPPEEVQRIHQAVAERQRLMTMSPREQLQYLKQKNGLL